MPQVSRNKLSIEDETKILKTLHLILANISTVEGMQEFLLSFLTPTEQLMLAKRLAIVILLREGYDESEIATALSVTKPTVAKLRYFVEAQGKGYEIAMRILANENLHQQIKQALISLAGYTARAAGGRVKPTIF